MSQIAGHPGPASTTVSGTSSTAPQFPRTAGEYEVGEVIGYGASAVVYRAKVKATNDPVALKIFNLEAHKGSSHIDVIRKEIFQLSSCHHPNIISYYCAFINQEQLWLVMELLSAGSCLDIMKYGFHDGMEEGLVRAILRETLKGIEYLHNSHRIHRDIKAGNILISSEGEVKLTDFGVSKYLVENGGRTDVTYTFVGTPCWMAPEVIEQVSGYDTRADIWSFGITAIELAKGKAPHAECAPMKIVLNILDGPPPRLEKAIGNKKFSQGLRDLIETCLQKEPSRRPSATRLLEHRFFKGVKVQAIKELVKELPPLSERVKQTKNLKAQDPPPTQIQIDFDFGSDEEDDSEPVASSSEQQPSSTTTTSHTLDHSSTSSTHPPTTSVGPTHSQTSNATTGTATNTAQSEQKVEQRGRFTLRSN